MEKSRCSIRTAQIHRKNNNPEWMKFLRNRTLTPPLIDAAPLPVLDLDNVPPSVERAREVEKKTWALFCRLSEQSEIEEESTQLAAIARAIVSARKAHVEAVEATRQAELDARMFIPLANVRELQRRLIPPLADAIGNLRNNIATSLPPDQRKAFFQAWAEQIGNWEHSLEAIDEGIENLLR